MREYDGPVRGFIHVIGYALAAWAIIIITGVVVARW